MHQSQADLLDINFQTHNNNPHANFKYPNKINHKTVEPLIYQIQKQARFDKGVINLVLMGIFALGVAAAMAAAFFFLPAALPVYVIAGILLVAGPAGMGVGAVLAKVINKFFLQPRYNTRNTLLTNIRHRVGLHELIKADGKTIKNLKNDAQRYEAVMTKITDLRAKNAAQLPKYEDVARPQGHANSKFTLLQNPVTELDALKSTPTTATEGAAPLSPRKQSR